MPYQPFNSMAGLLNGLRLTRLIALCVADYRACWAMYFGGGRGKCRELDSNIDGYVKKRLKGC